MSLIGLALTQIRATNPVERDRLLMDEFGRVWKGYTGAAASTYTHNGYDTIVPSGGTGADAWVLTDPSIATISVPLGSGRIASSGAAIAAFAAGTVDGMVLDSSEGLGIRWNDDTFTTFAFSTVLPRDLDPDAPITMYFHGARVGAADATTTLTVTGFFHEVGAAYTADANAGGSSSAFAAATTLVSTGTLTLAAADVPAGPTVLTFTVVPSAALDDDDFILFGIELRCVRKTRP